MSSVDQGRSTDGGADTRFGGVWWLVIVVAGATVISGVAHRIGEQWQPQGDDAAIAWLSRDVFTAHSPLLGMPSTVGGSGTGAHHWGPLLFWLFAIPARVGAANPAGFQLALLTLQLTMLGVIGWFAARRCGRVGALAILVGVSIMSWSFGRDLLSSIWNPSIALLPLAATFVLAWSIADGDDLALIPMAFTASFVVQCNLLYTPLVGLLVVWALLGWFVTSRERRRQPDPRAEALVATQRRRRRRVVIVALGVLLVVWSGPIVYELTHQPGNVRAVMSGGFGEKGEHVGVRFAVNGLVRAIGFPPIWSSPSSTGAMSRYTETPSPLAIGSSLLIGGVIVAGLLWSGRRRPGVRALLGTAVFGAGGAVIALSRLPVTFGVATYRTWNLWVVSVFVWLAFVLVVMTVGREVLARRSSAHETHPPRARRWIVAALLVSLGGFAVLGATGRSPGAMRDRDDSAAVRRLVDQTRRTLTDRGPYLAVQRVQNLGSGVLWGLERQGFDLRVERRSVFDGPYLAANHGPGKTPEPRLEIVGFASGTPGPSHGRLVAQTDVSATDQSLQVYRRALALVCARVQKDPPTITARGRELESGGLTPPAARALGSFRAGGSPCGVLGRDVLSELRSSGALHFSRVSAPFADLLGTVADASTDRRYQVRVLPPAGH